MLCILIAKIKLARYTLKSCQTSIDKVIKLNETEMIPQNINPIIIIVIGRYWSLNGAKFNSDT